MMVLLKTVVLLSTQNAHLTTHVNLPKNAVLISGVKMKSQSTMELALKMLIYVALIPFQEITQE